MEDLPYGHQGLSCAYLLRFPIEKAAFTHQPTIQERMRHSSPLLDGKLSSGAHLICQAGFLAYGSDARSPLLTCIRVMQWDIESGLSEYSDRIVQDSHLIPSSRLTARTLD